MITDYADATAALAEPLVAGTTAVSVQWPVMRDSTAVAELGDEWLRGTTLPMSRAIAA